MLTVVFTFGGPGGFQAQYGGPRRRQRPAAAADDTPSSPLVALLPILILFAFAMLSLLPSLFSGPHIPDPSYAFERTSEHGVGRTTWHWNVPYWVNKAEWEASGVWTSVPEQQRGQGGEAMYSSKVRQFERGVENNYVHKLRNEVGLAVEFANWQCEMFNSIQQTKINNEAGFFGIGADYDKIRALRREKSPACEQLRAWGVGQQQGYY